MDRCPHCDAPLVYMRLGVRLTSITLRIFDAVKRAGPHGIDASDLFNLIYANRPRTSRETLKANIYHLNNSLAATDWRIRCRSGAYVLRRE
jgi:hypothetical protein